MNIAKIAHKIQGQMQQFAGKLSAGMPKVARRFVAEALYGIQSRGSVKLSEIARSLDEGIALHKTITRLSNQLQRPGLLEHIEKRIIEEGARRVQQETLLIIDISDIVKPYAEKMQYMARVRDGSSGSLGDGYWTMQVVGVETGGKEITPLYHELYSQDSPDFKSENKEIEKAVETVSSQVHGNGIWMIDRGGDRRKLFNFLLQNKKRFIIRLVGDRHVVYRGKTVVAEELARSCPLLYTDRLIKEDKEEEQAYTISYGFRKVTLPGSKERLWMVVVAGFGKEPLMLLTTEQMENKRQ